MTVHLISIRKKHLLLFSAWLKNFMIIFENLMMVNCVLDYFSIDLQKLAYSEPFKKNFFSVWRVWQRTSYLSYPILSWYTYRLTNREFQIILLVNYKGGFD